MNRSGRGLKVSNEYAQAFGRLYAETPKAVFAAIVWSFCSEGGSSPDLATNKFLEEWRVLNHNGIVPQQAPGRPAE